MWITGLILALVGLGIGAFVTLTDMSTASRDVGEAIAAWMHLASLVALAVGVAMIAWG